MTWPSEEKTFSFSLLFKKRSKESLVSTPGHSQGNLLEYF